jgi:DNA processing protein
MDAAERIARAELALKYQLSPVKALNVIKETGSALAFCRLTPDQRQKLLPEMTENRDFSVRELERFQFVVLGESMYPYLLSQIPDPPLVLFYRGAMSSIDLSRSVAIVGTRRPTSYGKMIADRITVEVVQSGLATISGLAFGIDALVHKKTLANQGRTIAVLGTGINTPYPAAHKYIYDQICANGGVILSESYLDAPYSKWVFPKRNRIIAGLTPLTIVIEAALKSGALLTANFAFQYDREVLAVPGPITSDQSQGTNMLIRSEKARLYSDNRDILELFGISGPEQLRLNLDKLSLVQRELIKYIAGGMVQVDQLADRMHLEIDKLNQILGVLELSKFITRSGSGTVNLQIATE